MKRTTLALASAIALLSAGAAIAQQPPGPPAGRPGMHMQRPDPARMAERHAQHLRDTLQLTSAQEPALRAFVGSMQPRGERGDRMRDDGSRGDRGRDAARSMTTPERLDRMRARMAERQARFEQHATAVKRFYAQLTPSQQKAFDAIRPMGGHRGGGGHGGRGHGGPGHDGPGHRGGPGGPGGHQHQD